MSTTPTAPISEEEEAKRGQKLADTFYLKEAFRDDQTGRVSWEPKRYRTEGGTKTALGIYRTAKSILEGTY